MNPAHYLYIFIETTSLSLQLVAAFVSLRLIPVTGRRVAWTMIASALILMSVRRLIPLIGLFSGNYPAFNVTSEIIGLVLSFCMLLGVLGIGPVFRAIKRSEESARLSQEKLARHLQQNLLGVIEWDTELRIREWNPAAETIFGYSREEMLDREGLRFVISVEGIDTSVRHLHDLMNEHESRTYIVASRSKNGQAILCEWLHTPLYDAHNAPLGVISLIRDITEQERAETELRAYRDHLEELVLDRTNELEEKNQLLKEKIVQHEQAEIELRKLYQAVEQSPSAVLMIDSNHGIEYVNMKFSEISGCNIEEVVGRSVWDCEIMKQHEEMLRAIDKIISTGKSWAGEFESHRKNGEAFWASMALAPIFNDAGKIVNYTAVIEDVTERKQLEVKLREAKEAADASNRSKSLFLANMSHEIRTPMNAILGFSQLLQRDSSVTEGQLRQLEIINRNGEYLLSLINDILEMSKIEAGRVTLNESVFNLPALLEDLDTFFHSKTVSKHLLFSIERKTELPKFIRSDPPKLRQILINLLTNAVKFTTEGGIILRIAAWNLSDTRYEIAFEVEDSGVGISEDDQKRLFHHFEQAESGRKSGTGTGLGLAISKEFVELMGGKLTVSSVLGRGSVFRFSIQVDEDTSMVDEPATENRQVKAIAAGSPRHRILVVDDMENGRELLAQWLNDVGFQIRTAVNGKEALDEYRVFQPHLIFMDLRMPVMDGYEAIRLIRSSDGGSDVKIVALSASVFEDTREKFYVAGADAFLPKPFHEKELFSTIHTQIGTEFEFLEPVEKPAPEDPVDHRLMPEELNYLPQELLSALQQAAKIADYESIVALLQKIPEEHTTVREKIEALVVHYDYRKLLQLIDERIAVGDTTGGTSNGSGV